MSSATTRNFSVNVGGRGPASASSTLLGKGSTGAVCEVIIPIHNALSQTIRCIESVISFSTVPYRLILVNDRSDRVTTDYLSKLQNARPEIILLENETNLGFLPSVNRALKHTQNSALEFKIILNSDTIVTPGWLESFKRCFDSDRLIGLATAVSNNAENLSLKIPAGHNVFSLARLIQSQGQSIGYPDIATAIGFCMGIRSEVLEKLGGFDEAFSPGYAEDSDYHFRVLKEGYRAVLVSDCFVYHESHASFSGKKAELVAKNRPLFDRRWSTIYGKELESHNNSRSVELLQSEVQSDPGFKVTEHDVVFIMPIPQLCGGTIVVYELINQLILGGINATAIILTEPAEIPMDLLFTPYFIPPYRWNEAQQKKSIPAARAYVATYFETCTYALLCQSAHSKAHVSYLIQGYEPWFPEATIEQVVRTYRAIPNRIVVSEWLRTMLGRWGLSAEKIPDGLDTNSFYPADGKVSKNETPVVLTLLRDDPQSGWRTGLRVLQQLKAKRPDVRIAVVGPLATHPDVTPLCSLSYPYADRKEMREIYRNADIFFDCSMVQGFGLMGLEAMASGLAVVVTKSGGPMEYANADNSLIVDAGSDHGVAAAIISLIDDRDLRTKLQTSARASALQFDWRQISGRYLTYFENLLNQPFEQDAASLRAQNEYFAADFLYRQTEKQHFLEAEQLFVDELVNRAEPRSAEDLLQSSGKSDVLETLRASRDGSGLINLFEHARLLLSERGLQNIQAFGERFEDNFLLRRIASIVPPFQPAEGVR